MTTAGDGIISNLEEAGVEANRGFFLLLNKRPKKLGVSESFAKSDAESSPWVNDRLREGVDTIVDDTIQWR
jgi:hypothetical protein